MSNSGLSRTYIQECETQNITIIEYPTGFPVILSISSIHLSKGSIPCAYDSMIIQPTQSFQRLINAYLMSDEEPSNLLNVRQIFRQYPHIEVINIIA